jgi:hypothetical protein
VNHGSRTVWILARPLTSKWFPAIKNNSDGKFRSCHWAVLFTHDGVTVTDIKAAALQARLSSVKESKIVLGTLFELKRVCRRNAVNVCSSFGTAELRTDWSIVSSEYVGNTNLTDADISAKGVSLK